MASIESKEEKEEKKEEKLKYSEKYMPDIVPRSLIEYQKGAAFVFFATYNYMGTSTNVAVKIYQLSTERYLRQGLYILEKLKPICPHLVDIYDIRQLSFDEISEWINLQMKHFTGRKLIPRTIDEIKELENKIAPRSSKELKAALYYARIRVELAKAFDASRSPWIIEIMEQVASPFNLGHFRNIGVTGFLSLVFQVLWTANCYRMIGAIHGDFYSRNMWLQPILKKYKYVVYIIKSNIVFYIPLILTQHYIIKVGDYGGSVLEANSQEVKDSFAQLYTTLKSARNVCSECKETINALMECIDTEMKTCTIERPEKFSPEIAPLPIYDPVFTPFTVRPDDFNEETSIMPKDYYNPNIVDWNRHV